MINKLIERRDSLKQELVRATDILAKKQSEVEGLNRTMLRIGGAIQVLDEKPVCRRLREGEGKQYLNKISRRRSSNWKPLTK